MVVAFLRDYLHMTMGRAGLAAVMLNHNIKVGMASHVLWAKERNQRMSLGTLAHLRECRVKCLGVRAVC